MYTERHNKAGRILLDAIYNGARGDICMADVEPAALRRRRRPTSASTTPAEMLPQADQGTEEARWLRTKRPDIMLCNTQGHSQEDRARHDICIGAQDLPDTRPTDQLTAARLQHEELVERLVQRLPATRSRSTPSYSASAAPSTRQRKRNVITDNFVTVATKIG
jgi:hypothetical protein